MVGGPSGRVKVRIIFTYKQNRVLFSGSTLQVILEIPVPLAHLIT
jgi:hypothetical protein